MLVDKKNHLLIEKCTKYEEKKLFFALVNVNKNVKLKSFWH